MSNIRIIKRYSEPNGFDHAPHGSYCYVYRDEFSCDVYVQSSSDEEDPDWHYMGIKIIEDVIDE